MIFRSQWTLRNHGFSLKQANISHVSQAWMPFCKVFSRRDVLFVLCELVRWARTFVKDFDQYRVVFGGYRAFFGFVLAMAARFSFSPMTSAWHTWFQINGRKEQDELRSYSGVIIFLFIIKKCSWFLAAEQKQNYNENIFNSKTVHKFLCFENGYAPQHFFPKI